MNQQRAMRSLADQRDAEMILEGLKLAISAGTDVQAQRADALVLDTFKASDLTLADLEDLKAAAAAGMTSKDSSEVQSRSMLKRHAVQS